MLIAFPVKVQNRSVLFVTKYQLFETKKCGICEACAEIFRGCSSIACTWWIFALHSSLHEEWANKEFTAGTVDVQILAVLLGGLYLCVCKRSRSNYSASKISWGDFIALGCFEVWSLIHVSWAATVCPLCLKNRGGQGLRSKTLECKIVHRREVWVRGNAGLKTGETVETG